MDEAKTRRFNRILMALSLAWLAIVVPVRGHFSPIGTADFEAYYVPAVAALRGRWDSLYPQPRPDAVVNPTLSEGSVVKPGYLQTAHEVGAGTSYLFVQPPPVALLYAALYGWLPLGAAHLLHMVLAVLAAWLTACVAGAVYEALMGRPSRGSGLVCLLVVLAPLTLASVRQANVTLFIAALLGLGLLGLLQRLPVTLAAGALVLAALLKYVSLVWIPLALTMRHWRLLGLSLGLGAAVLVATLGVTGLELFREFVSLLPSLSRGATSGQNQSALSMLQYLTGSAKLPGAVATGLTLFRLGLLAGVLASIGTRKPSTWESPEKVCAAAAVLLAWFYVFSPISWYHGAFYFCSLWGWAVWEGQRSRFARLLSGMGIGLTFVPISGAGRVKLPFPLNFHLLLGVLAFAALGISALQRQAPPRSDDVASGLVPGR